MKSRRWVFLAAAVLASVAGAQESPSEVTDAEIVKYKKAAYAGCREPGLARGHPEAKVDGFCTCFMAALDKTMKRTEWQQAYFYWLKEQETEAKGVLAPHVQNLGYCMPK